jgi:site-specific recombinase XerD
VLQGGADLKHIQELLGHRSISSTAIYTRVGIRDLLSVIERAHPRERRRPRS